MKSVARICGIDVVAVPLEVVELEQFDEQKLLDELELAHRKVLLKMSLSLIIHVFLAMKIE